MKPPFLPPRACIVLTLFVAFIATGAQAVVDVGIDSLSLIGETTVLPHREVKVSYQVSNMGDEDSGGFWLYFYLSTDGTITEDDDWRASAGYSNLAPGQSRSDYKGLRFNDVSRGDYTIGVIINCSGDVDLSNNVGTAGSVTILRPTDLSVESVDTDVSAEAGDRFFVQFAIHNGGIGPSDDFTVDCFARDYYIGGDVLGPLGSGETRSYEVLCDLPGDIPEGYYTIRVVVSCPYDDNPGNNEGTSSMGVGLPIDLSVESVEITPNLRMPGEEFVIHSTIKNIGGRPSQSYTVAYHLSTDTVITPSDFKIGYAHRDGLAPGAQDSYDTIVRAPFTIPPGHYYVGMLVTCEEERYPANNEGVTAGTIELVHPAGYVCGQVLYQDREGRDHPVRYAEVEIRDADDNIDPLHDRLIGKTHTDEMGNYGVVVREDGQSGQNIYVRVFTEAASGAYPGATSAICSVKDDVLKEPYCLQSALRGHPRNSSVIINTTARSSGGEFMVYDSLVEAFVKAKTFLNVEMDASQAFWPSSEDASYYEPVVGIYIARDDRGDRDVIMHEYGHYIAEACTFAQGSVGDSSVHVWNLDLRGNPIHRTDEEARNLAFRESWASLFSIATQYGDKEFLYAGDTRYDDMDEETRYTFSVDLETQDQKSYTPGEFYENMNCGALWDIFDEASKEEGGDSLSDPSLSKTWTIMRDYKPDDIIDFWNSWFQVYDYKQEMAAIFREHQMLPPQSPVLFPNVMLTPSDGKLEGHFGHSVAICGDYAIVGAYGDVNKQGAAYVFKREGTEWIQQAKLTESNGPKYFGYSVSMSGDYALVGTCAPTKEYRRRGDNEQSRGCAYVFKRDGMSWIRQAKLDGVGNATHDFFGGSVSIDGDYAIVGASCADSPSIDMGSAYIFKRDGTRWIEQAKLGDAQGRGYNYFGLSVSINADYAIVTSDLSSRNSEIPCGPVHVFRRDGSAWVQQDNLTTPDTQSSLSLGNSITIRGDYVLVGAPQGDSSQKKGGVAHLFERRGTTWAHQAEIGPLDGTYGDSFGSSVSIDGDYIVVGAEGDDHGGRDSGSAYLFKRQGTTWTQQTKIVAQDATYDDFFGCSVSISGDYVIIGAEGNDSKRSNCGAAYIFKWTGDSWMP